MVTPCLPINLTTGPKHLKRKKPLHNNTCLQRDPPPPPPPPTHQKKKKKRKIIGPFQNYFFLRVCSLCVCVCF
jgi:hypothetical protein